MARLAESALVKLDRSLLSALVDRWRPETHTFHLPCGEMAPTLQDVAMLLGLPITGDAVGPRVVPSTWLEDLEERFAGVATTIDPEDFNEHPQSKGPSKSWLLQFQVQFRTKRCVDVFYGFEITHVFLILNVRTSLQPDLLAAVADEYSVTRSLETYLLCCLGTSCSTTHTGTVWIGCFCPTHRRSPMQMRMPYPYIVGVQRFLHAHIVDSARHHDRMIGMLS